MDKICAGACSKIILGKSKTCDSCHRAVHADVIHPSRCCAISIDVWKDGKQNSWDICWPCYNGIHPGKWALPHATCECGECADWRLAHPPLLAHPYEWPRPPPELLIKPKDKGSTNSGSETNVKIQSW
jgi:hypothetical protein